MLPKLPPLRPAAIAARIDAAPNLVTLFLDRADEQPAAPFLVAKVGGEWRTISWGEARDIVASLSAALFFASNYVGCIWPSDADAVWNEVFNYLSVTCGRN